MTSTIIHRLKEKTAVIGIVGLGYVGLPLALRFSDVGYKVIGFENDTRKISNLQKSRSYISHIPANKISHALLNGFEPTADYSQANTVDALIICVPTPLNKFREPDLSYVINTMDALVPHLREGQIISLESTTYPGTTEEELLPRIESSGLKVGKDIHLVFSPEREDPGNSHFSTQTIPKICGGHTSACLEAGITLYEQVIDEIVPVSSTRAAELTKLLENIHRAVNIGLVNEMKIVADKMNIDIHEVIRAAATKPFGFVPYYPGPGLGGHCIAIDPFYLTWKAREYGVHTRFIELASEVNTSMHDFVITKVTTALNSVQKSVNGSRILVLGIAYKKNIDDLRESPSVILIEKLHALGAQVSYADPYIPEFLSKSESALALSSIEITAKALVANDCILIATDHDAFNYEMIAEYAKLIIDSRGRYIDPAAHIFKA